MSRNAEAACIAEINEREDQRDTERQERAALALIPQTDALETIRWISVKTAFPDADTTVLMCDFGGSEPVWLGYTDGSDWWDVAGERVAMPTHWASVPAGAHK